ncbi:Met-10+ like-protein-domain-containing protein [Cladochytrium replicatum]|nr:Met-10+ like-protein-domain-containing protein [Cladochytrium replicatum]
MVCCRKTSNRFRFIVNASECTGNETILTGASTLSLIRIRTVVNKTDNIDHTFRFFKMELLAGENDMKTEVKEHGCIMKFNFSKVYRNSRLQVEDHRLVNMFKSGDLVISEVFAGVGPFALPAAKNKGCTVFANNLNPCSNQYLCLNIEIQKLGGKVIPFNLDGRHYIQKLLSKLNE